MLKGQTIHLRTVRKTDLDTLYDLMCDIEVRGPHFPVAFESQSSFLERFGKTGFWEEERGILLLMDNATDRILGHLLFFKPEPYYNAYELGYILYDVEARGKGITSQAVNMFVKYLFELKHVYRLQIQFNLENVASKRVAQKCGFKPEGVARNAIIVNGKPVDLEVYSITREDFENSASSQH